MHAKITHYTLDHLDGAASDAAGSNLLLELPAHTHATTSVSTSRPLFQRITGQWRTSHERRLNGLRELVRVFGIESGGHGLCEEVLERHIRLNGVCDHLRLLHLFDHVIEQVHCKNETRKRVEFTHFNEIGGAKNELFESAHTFVEVDELRRRALRLLPLLLLRCGVDGSSFGVRCSGG
jgi:hypothetical protein